MIATTVFQKIKSALVGPGPSQKMHEAWKKSAPEWEEVQILSNPEPPEDFEPIVTEFGSGILAEAVDVEGGRWTLRTASGDGRLIYLSGENGEVQIQFLREEFSNWVSQVT